MESFEHAGLTFRVSDTGPRDGETIVLLHGFPQLTSSWSEVAGALARAGYRVLVPEQRGYSAGARPSRRLAYRLHHLTADTLALLDQAGVRRTHLVGHDWGGGVGWVFAALAPERLLSLTVISTPHPRALLRTILTTRQALLSWYLLFFQIPYLPESLVRAKNGALARRWLRALGLREPHVRRYADHVVADPGALTGALNWYRAMPFDAGHGLRLAKSAAPTCYVWSDGDETVSRQAAEQTARWVSGPYRYEVIPGETHWIPEHQPARLAEIITRHARGAATSNG